MMCQTEETEHNVYRRASAPTLTFVNKMKIGLLLVALFLFVCSCSSFRATKSSYNSKEHWQRVLEQTKIPMDIPDLNLFRPKSGKPTETEDTESFFFNNFQSNIKVPIFIDPSIATNIMASGEISTGASTLGCISALTVLDTICRLDGLEYKITDDGILITKLGTNGGVAQQSTNEIGIQKDGEQ